MSENQQNNLLADYIVTEVPGAPNGTDEDEDEDVCSCAVRLLKKYRAALEEIMSELGVPDKNYPASVANAYEIAWRAVTGKRA